MLRLPTIPQEQLDIQPFDWSGIPRRFMNSGELEVLIALVKSVTPEPHVMIEFGVNEGRTAKAIIREVKSISLYIGVDVEFGYVPAKKVQRGEVPTRPAWMVKDDPLFHLELRPRGSLDLKVEDLPELDVAFIDGDHGATAVKHDTYLALARVRRGGIIIWHDYHDLGTVDVRDVLHEFQDLSGLKITHVAGTWLAYMRVGE